MVCVACVHTEAQQEEDESPLTAPQVLADLVEEQAMLHVPCWV